MDSLSDSIIAGINGVKLENLTSDFYPLEETKKIKLKMKGDFISHQNVQDVLSQVYPDKTISEEAREYLNSLLYSIFVSVISQVNQESKELSHEDVKKIARTIIPGELWKHAFCEMKRSIQPGREPVFSTQNMRKNMEEKYSGFITKEAVCYMTSLIEYISAEILEISGKQCEMDDVEKVEKEHIVQAIKEDEELDKLFQV